MIDGLELALEAWAAEGARELVPALEQLLGGAGGRVLAAERLPRNRVLRVRVELDGCVRGVLVKRFPPERAHRERAAIERWLPQVGLEAQGPPLLGTVADRTGRCTWFVYEDLGNCTLAEHASDPERVRAAALLLAELHARFSEHPLLGEVRCLGADLGIAFYTASVRDAARALTALIAQAPLESTPRALCMRLIERLSDLRAEQAERTAAIEAWGGPETLLHGDPWTTNMLVRPAAEGFEARLIDWDHAGVGPASYDLSAFLLRFPPEARDAILSQYRQHRTLRTAGGWQCPARAAWNALFDTAELARLANTVLWRTLAGLDGHLAWALSELARLEEAFTALAPVLPAEASGEGPCAT